MKRTAIIWSMLIILLAGCTYANTPQATPSHLYSSDVKEPPAADAVIALYDELTIDADGDGNLETLQLIKHNVADANDFTYEPELVYRKDGDILDSCLLFSDIGKVRPFFMQTSTEYSSIPLVLIGYESNSHAYRTDYQVYYIENGQIQQYSPADSFLASIGGVHLTDNQNLQLAEEGKLMAALDSCFRMPQSDTQLAYFMRTNGVLYIDDRNADNIIDLEYEIVAYDVYGKYVKGTIWLQYNTLEARWEIVDWTLPGTAQLSTRIDRTMYINIPSVNNAGYCECNALKDDITPVTALRGKYSEYDSVECIVDLNPKFKVNLGGSILEGYLTHSEAYSASYMEEYFSQITTASIKEIKERFGPALYESKYALTYLATRASYPFRFFGDLPESFPDIFLYNFRFGYDGSFEAFEISGILDYLVFSAKLSYSGSRFDERFLFSVCNVKALEIQTSANCVNTQKPMRRHSNGTYYGFPNNADTATKSWSFFPAGKVYWLDVSNEYDAIYAYHIDDKVSQYSAGTFAWVVHEKDYTGDGKLDVLLEVFSQDYYFLLEDTEQNRRYIIRDWADIHKIKTLFDTSLLEEDIGNYE